VVKRGQQLVIKAKPWDDMLCPHLLSVLPLPDPVTADAAMTCDEAAKMKYPDSIVDRLKYKRECKRAWRHANGKGVFNKLKG
jgi:hypothetical protein